MKTFRKSGVLQLWAPTRRLFNMAVRLKPAVPGGPRTQKTTQPAAAGRVSGFIQTTLKKLTQSAGLALGALSLGASSALAQAAPSAPWVPSAPPPTAAGGSAVQRGVYGFDGTRTDESNNSVIRQFVQGANAQRKGYFAGTDLLADSYRQIVEDGVTRICSEHQAQPFDEVYLTGWSRGAVAAMHVAAEVENRCGLTPRWVGAVDAVSSGIASSYDFADRERNVFDTRCLHVVKEDGVERRPFLQTSGFLSCPKTRLPGDHTSIAFSADTLNFLKRDAARLAPDLFSDTTDVSPAPKLDVRACLNAGGTWTNALCELGED
jgi:hypothetical protein